MRKVIFLVFIVVGCSSRSDFSKYLDSLNHIKNPSLLGMSMDVDVSPAYDSALFRKYKHAWSVEPVGILYKNEHIIATIEYAVADNGYAPILMTYNLSGVKKDSMYLIGGSGYGEESKTIQNAHMKEDLTFTIIDSTTTWINGDDFEPIDSTISLNVSTLDYFIDLNGKIKTMANNS